MDVEGNRFLEKLYQECRVRFNATEKEDDAETVEELLINKIKRAVNQGIISEPTAQHIEDSIGRLKERSITQLTPSEKNKVLAALQGGYAKKKGK